MKFSDADPEVIAEINKKVKVNNVKKFDSVIQSLESILNNYFYSFTRMVPTHGQTTYLI